MSILTHEEAKRLRDSSNDPLELIRETERAVVAKLAAGVSVEPELPAGQMPVDWDICYYTQDQLQTAIAAARVQALEEAANIAERGDAADWSISGQIARGIRALIGTELPGYRAGTQTGEK